MPILECSPESPEYLFYKFINALSFSNLCVKILDYARDHPNEYDNSKILGHKKLKTYAIFYKDFVQLMPLYKKSFGEALINDLNKIIINVSDDKVYLFTDVCLKSKYSAALSIEQIDSFISDEEEEGFLDIMSFLCQNKVDISTSINIETIIKELNKNEKSFKDLLKHEVNRAYLKESYGILFENLRDENLAIRSLSEKIKDLDCPLESIYRASSRVIKPVASALQRMFYR